jgi:uncharacterized protein (TIGR02186 family)
VVRGWPRTRAWPVALALCGMLLLWPPFLARAQEASERLAADISDHLIAITTAFVGTTVVLFGTTVAGNDIAVTVVGPRNEQVVRRKSRVAGIWMNTDELTFRNVPSFYAVASNEPLDQMATPDVRARHELGLEYLRVDPVDAQGRDIGEITAFRDALIRNKQRQGLYVVDPGVVRFISPQLFRASIEFPASVPPGIYQVQVYELQDGQVSDAQRSTLVISKVGLEADLFDFARYQPELYGLLAIVLAVVSGWLAGVIFRRN